MIEVGVKFELLAQAQLKEHFPTMQFVRHVHKNVVRRGERYPAGDSLVL
ncbi:hypothetical protein KSF_111450 [Reticulibacter mediterranei]|uniref:Uncharacterized protein n=1 Tax=Reticulibacter mediterranei TaxID=2778369 RepID=A0A8J3J2E7_9CHLR|nr:hypothetical protein [Reticulibacter mediterranei]GHP01098.1 hypothetical protein KSF_111450 [Reticulibacter mediterranei]